MPQPDQSQSPSGWLKAIRFVLLAVVSVNAVLVGLALAGFTSMQWVGVLIGSLFVFFGFQIWSKARRTLSGLSGGALIGAGAVLTVVAFGVNSLTHVRPYLAQKDTLEAQQAALKSHFTDPVLTSMVRTFVDNVDLEGSHSYLISEEDQDFVNASVFIKTERAMTEALTRMSFLPSSGETDWMSVTRQPDWELPAYSVILMSSKAQLEAYNAAYEAAMETVKADNPELAELSDREQAIAIGTRIRNGDMMPDIITIAQCSGYKDGRQEVALFGYSEVGQMLSVSLPKSDITAPIFEICAETGKTGMVIDFETMEAKSEASNT